MRQMKFQILLVFLFACTVTAQVLNESSRNIGSGFREVSRSQVNPPGHWEGIGHFSFIYFGNKQLCQCNESEFYLSPSKKYAIFINDKTGALTLFTRQNEKMRALTQKYVGQPARVEWDEIDGFAVVHFYNDTLGKIKRETMRIVLESGT
jgi:hypothetical protein